MGLVHPIIQYPAGFNRVRSILGPLFLLYINDLANVSNYVLFALLFADDSNMLVSGKNPDELVNVMNAEMTKIVNLLRKNKLSLNLKNKHTSLHFVKREVKLRYRIT